MASAPDSIIIIYKHITKYLFKTGLKIRLQHASLNNENDVLYPVFIHWQ